MATDTIPLSADTRASYEDVYAKTQAAIDSTNDFALLEQLRATNLSIGNLLSADDQFRIAANSDTYHALKTQLGDTNDQLQALLTKIGAIAQHYGVLADVLGAITKVFSIAPGL